MKLIVTHLSPDLDSVTSSWLIKRYLPGWSEAKIVFVPAGETYNNQPPDSNKNILHLDTGLGKFDHHQTNEYTSATERVFKYLVEKNYIKKKDIEPIKRIVSYVTEIDNFAEAYYPQADDDRYDFSISQIIEGLKGVLKDDQKIIETGFVILEAVLQIFKNKIRAEKELTAGYVFQTKWGKAIAIETSNEEAVKLGLKKGFSIVIRKDPRKKHLRIKGLPGNKIDLTPLYIRFSNLDPKATWFLHSSKAMLLNGSAKNPKAIPTKLSLDKVIAMLKKI